VRLITAHRILIGAAIVFALIFAAVQVRAYVADGSGARLGIGLLSVVAAGALAFYYRSLAGWGRR
jgi:hypothetical protein